MTTHHCPSHPCPICYPQTPRYPPSYPHSWPSYYGIGTPALRGCVCPPGAEMTCQGLGCPRKGIGGKLNITCATATSAASGIETEGQDQNGLGAKPESPTGAAGDAQKEQQ